MKGTRNLRRQHKKRSKEKEDLKEDVEGLPPTGQKRWNSNSSRDKSITRSCQDGSVVLILYCSVRELGSRSQHPHWAEVPATSAPGEPSYAPFWPPWVPIYINKIKLGIGCTFLTSALGRQSRLGGRAGKSLILRPPWSM